MSSDDLAAMITRKLCDGVRQMGGVSWWLTHRLDTIKTEYAREPLVVVLAGIADVLRDGADSDWVVGDDTPVLAVSVAEEWLAADVSPEEVGDWLAAECWNPAVARVLRDAGVTPYQLLNDKGSPRYMVESPAGWHQSLGFAVADAGVSVTDAVAIVNGQAVRWWEH